MSSHDHDHGSELSDIELRVRALETILTEKGYVEQAGLDRIVERHETKIGPHIGARVIARAWSDPAFRAALLEDATKASAPLAHEGRVGDHLVAVENTPQTHNMIVCTLCSCYPWDVLGLPPVWYKSAPYRARTVKEPRAVLTDFGVSLPVGRIDPGLGDRLGAVVRADPGLVGLDDGVERLRIDVALLGQDGFEGADAKLGLGQLRTVLVVMIVMVVMIVVVIVSGHGC